MRILFLSAFYPPHEIGGWDQLVRDFNLRLQARGQTTHVLTSNFGALPAEQVQGNVSRRFSLDADLYHYHPLDFFFKRGFNNRANLQVLRETIRSFSPDVIFIHGMWLLWRGIPWYAEQLLPGRVVYYVADSWPFTPPFHADYWQKPANHAILTPFKKILAILPLKMLDRERQKYRLRFDHVLCVSRDIYTKMRQHYALAPEQIRVVYNGIEIEQFARLQHEDAWPGLSLLYAGNVTLAKGVHTLLEALNILAQQGQLDGITLKIVGSGHPDYEAQLQRRVTEYHLEQVVTFSDRVPRQEMPEILSQHDVLVFPSTGEALPRIVQEAMAAGLVVIGTTAGGTGEVLIEGQTGLTFLPGDADDLARQIIRLRQSNALYRDLQQQGRQLILDKFDFKKSVAAIEDYLQAVAATPAGASPSLVEFQQSELNL